MDVLMSRVPGRAGVSPKYPVWLYMVVFMSKVRGHAGVCPEGPCLAGDGVIPKAPFQTGDGCADV